MISSGWRRTPNSLPSIPLCRSYSSWLSKQAAGSSLVPLCQWCEHWSSTSAPQSSTSAQPLLTPQTTVPETISTLSPNKDTVCFNSTPSPLLGYFRSCWEKPWSPSNTEFQPSKLSASSQRSWRSQYGFCGTAAFSRQGRKANHCDVVSKESQKNLFTWIAQMIQKTNGCYKYKLYLQRVLLMPGKGRGSSGRDLSRTQ